MKNKLIALLMIAALIVTMAGCGSASSNESTDSSSAISSSSDSETSASSSSDSTDSGSSSGYNTSQNAAATATDFKVNRDIEPVFNTMEYTLWINIFYNDQASDYVDQETEKEGIFTTITDVYSGVTRYYVWGYKDQTKCCDWEWEMNVTDTANLPTPGSTIKVSGTFAASDDSLDGYWIEDPVITVENEYGDSQYDIDMGTMDGTLERVQIMNIQYSPEEFVGQSIYMFGRIYDSTTLQHPFYDEMWYETFDTETSIATGTEVSVTGTISSDGSIEDCEITSFE